MELNIRKTSWHYRLVWTFLENTPSPNLCTYFWQVIRAMLLALFLASAIASLAGIILISVGSMVYAAFIYPFFPFTDSPGFFQADISTIRIVGCLGLFITLAAAFEWNDRNKRARINTYQSKLLSSNGYILYGERLTDAMREVFPWWAKPYTWKYLRSKLSRKQVDYSEKLSMKNDRGPSGIDLAIEYFKAKKDKVCPTVNFVED